ncbi:MAG: phosphatidylglycerophosphatase A [Arenicellales bacterium]|jgi:phosphatidylglycerophosphatase A
MTFLDRLIIMLAQGMGAGRVSVAPGTFGTLVGLPVVWGLWQTNAVWYGCGLITIVVIAIVSSHRASAILGRHDDPRIVIDEIAGIVLALAWVPPTVPALVLGFVLFRAFDIAKPPPIGYLDRRVHGGIGIVVDDLVAGLATNVILQLIFRVI